MVLGARSIGRERSGRAVGMGDSVLRAPRDRRHGALDALPDRLSTLGGTYVRVRNDESGARRAPGEARGNMTYKSIANGLALACALSLAASLAAAEEKPAAKPARRRPSPRRRPRRPSSSASAPSCRSSMAADKDAEARRQRIDKLDDETQKLLSEYRKAVADAESYTDYAQAARAAGRVAEGGDGRDRRAARSRSRRPRAR